MPQLAEGTIVKVGFGNAEIISEQRKYGQDGYKIWDFDSGNGYGSVRRGYPRWVPASAVTVV